MEIRYLDEIDSTHLYLTEAIRKGKVKPPLAICADRQTGGIGSRGDRWIGMEGNLFLSFCVDAASLPSDLPRQSMSIWFSWLLKEVLAEEGSKIWLKWPNDFYLGDQKAGGTITAVLRDNIVVCSIGLNLKKAPENFAVVDVQIPRERLLERYFLKLKQDIFWKDIFRKYKVEFLQSTRFPYFDKVTQKRLHLKDAVLQEDGSILIENRRVYSLR